MCEKTGLKQRWIYFLIFTKGLFYSVLAIFVFYIGLNVVAPRGVVPIFGFQHFVISSTSMEPDLLFGDVVVVKQAVIAEIGQGDIITYYAIVDPENPVEERITHYVARVDVLEDGSYEFRTRRAGTNTFDSWIVTEDDVVGIYVGHFGGIGKITLFMSHPLGLRVLIINVVIIALIVFVIFSKKLELKVEDDDDENIK